ncbi:MAG: hypothetical protein ACFB02_05535 [Mastigocoleus sp.]
MQREQNVALLPKPDSQNYPNLSDNSPDLIVALLNHYSFDLGGFSANELVAGWRQEYPVAWLRLAIIEALYQGRYKAISVQQILTIWQRRKQSTYHFNLEFETLICSKLPEDFPSHNKISLLPLPHNHSNGKVNTKMTSKLGATRKATSLNNQANNQANNGKRTEPSLISLPNQSHSSHLYNSSDQLNSSEIPREISETLQSETLHRNRQTQTIEPRNNTNSNSFWKNQQENPNTIDNVEVRNTSDDSQIAPEDITTDNDNYYYQSQKIVPSTQVFLSAYKKHQLFGQKRNLTPSEEYLVNSESNLSDKLAKFVPPNITHPPIGQFTPDNSDRSESFTCKLRAIAQDEV